MEQSELFPERTPVQLYKHRADGAVEYRASRA